MQCRIYPPIWVNLGDLQGISSHTDRIFTAISGWQSHASLCKIMSSPFRVSILSFYLTKAIESLLTAETESINGRYNSCANRCYYACFQAAIAAILNEGIRPAGQWNHQFVQAQFVGILINQRKRYDSELRRVLCRQPKSSRQSRLPP